MSDRINVLFDQTPAEFTSGMENITAYFSRLSHKQRGSSTSDKSQEEDEEEFSPPRDTLQRRQSVAAESFNPEEEEETGEESRTIYPKTDVQRESLSKAVKQIVLFQCLDEEQTSLLIDAMQEKKVTTGDVIIKQGDDGDNFYVIGTGVYDVYVRPQSAPSEELGDKVHSYSESGFFGELALMYNTSRAATIKAASDGVLWFMDRNTFRRIVLKSAFQKRQFYEELLKDVQVLKELSPYERMNVADALQARVYEDNECIIRQGETGKEMFIIESGSVRVMVKEKDKEAEVNRLGKGAYFGEMALITKKPRVASVYAVGKTKVASLDVDSFERLLGPCVQVMERNMDTYQEQIKSIMGSATATV